MTITPSLFEAFLKCLTKCWLRETNEQPSGNPYAEWAEAQNESFRAAQTERLLAETPPAESARSPAPENLKTAKWLLAADVSVRTPNLPRSSRREEAPSENAERGIRNAESSQSLVTSAATGNRLSRGSAQLLAPMPVISGRSSGSSTRRRSIRTQGRWFALASRSSRRQGSPAENAEHGIKSEPRHLGCYRKSAFTRFRPSSGPARP